MGASVAELQMGTGWTCMALRVVCGGAGRGTLAQWVFVGSGESGALRQALYLQFPGAALSLRAH